MATNNGKARGGGNRPRGGRSNNPDGRNQFGGTLSALRDNPLAAALAAGGAVAAGVFLWSRRNQVSEQISSLSDQISERRKRTGSNRAADNVGSGQGFIGSLGSGRRARRTQAEIAEEALTLKETGEPA